MYQDVKSKLNHIRAVISKLEKNINKYIEVRQDEILDTKLLLNDDNVILNYIGEGIDTVRCGGDKPISLGMIPVGMEPVTIHKIIHAPDLKDYRQMTRNDKWIFVIDRRPFSKNATIWKLALIQNSTCSAVVTYHIFKDSFDYYHCISNDALYIDECTPIMDIKLKQELEAFAEESLILNLTPEYKQFMKKVYSGEIDLDNPDLNS